MDSVFSVLEFPQPWLLQSMPLQPSPHTFVNIQVVANDLLMESYDKRYSPATFIAEKGEGYSVGWYADGYVPVRHFSNLADAATDYVLFSLGKARSTENSN